MGLVGLLLEYQRQVSRVGGGGDHTLGGGAASVVSWQGVAIQSTGICSILPLSMPLRAAHPVDYRMKPKWQRSRDEVVLVEVSHPTVGVTTTSPPGSISSHFMMIVHPPMYHKVQ